MERRFGSFARCKAIMEEDDDPRTYLGDSVYAELQQHEWGCRVKLTTNNGYPDDPRNVIYLEPVVFEALLFWYKRATGQ